MEPVNIDFMLGGNVAQEGPKIEKSFNDITNASKSAVDSVGKVGQAAVDAVKANIEKTKETIKNLESMVTGLKKKMDDATPGNAKQNAILDYNEAYRSLNTQKTILAGLEKQQIDANKAEESSQGGVISSLGKWAIGLFSVTAALEIGKRIIASTEGTTHAFEIATEKASSGVGYFFKTIASGDWSNFTNGMAQAIQGAKDYVNAMEDVLNKTNEQKIKSSALNIEIGKWRAESYSTDPKVVKEALKNIIRLQTQKLTEESNLAKQNYEIHRKKIADDNNWNEKDLENTIKYYSKNKEYIEKGERYNELKRNVKGDKTAWGSPGASARSAEFDKLVAELGANAEKYSKIAAKFSLVTFPQRDEVADLLAKSQDATAAININNRRDKQRLVGIEKKEEDDAAAAAKKAQDEKNKRIKEQLDFTTEIGKKRIKNAFEIEQLVLDAEIEGAEKSRKQADLDFRKKLSDLDIEKAEYIKRMNLETGGIDKATGKPTKKFTAIIPEEDQKDFDDKSIAYLKIKNAKITEINKKELDKLKALFVKYEDERVKIKEKSDKDIQDWAQAGFIIQAADLANDRDEKISAVSERLIKETDLYKLASGKQLLISKELTQQLIAESKKQIAAAVANPDISKRLSQADADNLLAKLDKADLTVQKTDNPFADLIDGLEKYKQARTEQSQTNAKDDIANFSRLEDAANKAQKATMEAVAGALQGISSILSQVSGELTGLTDAEKKTVDEVVNLINGAATLAQGIATGNPVAIIQGAIGLLVSLYKLLDTSSQKAEKTLNDSKDKVDALTIAYDKLGVAIQKAYSTDKANLINQQNQNLKDDLAEKQKQLAIENQKSIDKKHFGANISSIDEAIAYLFMPNTDKTIVSGLTKEINDLLAKIAETPDALTEALTGVSVMSAIDEFANAYADAFSTGENAALKSADIVKNILKQKLVEDLKNDIKTPIQELMDMVANGATQAAIDAKKLSIDAIATANQKAFEDLGLNTTAAKGIQGDVKNMTEDTGSALVGQITAMRLNVAEIVSGYKNSAAMMSQQIALQQRIADNTEFCRKLERMDSTMEYWRVNGMKVV